MVGSADFSTGMRFTPEDMKRLGDLGIYIDRIRMNLAEEIGSYRVYDGGWTNLVIEINDKWIFRFVRDRSNTQIEVERAFLPRFAPISPIPVPHLIHSGSDYIAYRKIEGERFAPARWAALPARSRVKMIAELGRFLTALHSLEFNHPNLSLAPYGGGNFWEDLWPAVAPRLTTETRTKARQFFQSSMERVKAHPFENRITHSDLATNNIMADFDAEQINGIIDFGDIALSDPAVDFAGFYRHFGQNFVDMLLTNYMRPIEKNFASRIEYHAKRKHFFVVFFALTRGLDQHVPNLLDTIENGFANR